MTITTTWCLRSPSGTRQSFWYLISDKTIEDQSSARFYHVIKYIHEFLVLSKSIWLVYRWETKVIRFLFKAKNTEHIHVLLFTAAVTSSHPHRASENMTAIRNSWPLLYWDISKSFRQPLMIVISNCFYLWWLTGLQVRDSAAPSGYSRKNYYNLFRGY